MNHLQRANYEDGSWVKELEDTMQRALGQLHAEADLTQLQKDLASLRTRDGGLAYGGLPERSGTAYLASWALCLKQVAGELGVLSLAAFHAGKVPRHLRQDANG